MNIFHSSQIKTIEEDFIKQGIVTSLELMHRASSSFTKWLIPKISKNQHIAVISGVGNNGADGVLISMILASKGYSVSIGIVGQINKGTDEFIHQYQLALSFDYIKVFHILDVSTMPILNGDTIIIDALFGIGLNRPPIGIHLDIINWMNNSRRKIYSVDIPSGMYADKLSNGTCINADATLSFHFPKKSFFHKENARHIGNWQIANIGIKNDHITTYLSTEYLVTQEMVKCFIPKRANYSHKGTYGHVLGIAGSEGMVGAAILLGKAAIRLGAGLCTICSDEPNRSILQNNLPEALFSNLDQLLLDRAYTYAIGPGLGNEGKAKSLFVKILDQTARPLVIDADGLNMIAEDSSLLSKIPANSILTPHPKEFSRLFGQTQDTFARLQLQQQSAKNLKCIIVLKDHHTTICTPTGEIYYNNTGNPGMATGGSGDVLTGIIASLLAQGLSSDKAAIAGVHLHGLAADIFCRHNDMNTLTPSDIINYISNALKETLQ